jgi:hypothetical protein
VTLEPDVVQAPARLELRVKNPDGTVSDWAPLEIRAGSGPPESGVSP